MGYFRELPDLLYQSNLQHKISSREYVRVKNFFRRVKLVDELRNAAVLFEPYQILEGQRPDTIAEKIYGRESLDYVVVLSAGITNIRSEWPLSDRDLYRYVENKYGATEINENHHHETIEVRDTKGRLILPAGQIVDETFKIPPAYNVSGEIFYIGIGAESNVQYKTVSGDINPVIGVSNYEYEVIENNKKRSIDVLKPSYLQQFLADIRDIMNYKESSQYVNNKLIQTDRTRLSGP